jgi:predicted nucleotidyltransferase
LQRLDGAGALAELDIQAILRELVEGGVEFLLIGGVAVGYHGYVRATKDVDVVPAPDGENLERLAAVLRRLDAEVEGAGDFDEGELPDPRDPEALGLGGNWVLSTRLGRLDVMQWIGEWELWGELSPAAIEEQIDGLLIRIVGYEDLVKLKELAGRPEDLTDLQRLREARSD